MNSFLQDLWEFFVPFLKPYKFRMFLLALLPVLWCLAETAAPYFIKVIIDRLAHAQSYIESLPRMLTYATLAYAALTLLLEFSLRLCNYIWIKTFPQIRADIQTKALQQTQTLSYQFFQDHFAGDLISRYRSLSESFEKIFSSFLYGFYPTVLSFMFALAFIFFISPLFAGMFLLWFCSMILVTLFYFKKGVVFSKEKAKAQNILYGYVGDHIGTPLSTILFSRDFSKEKTFHNFVQSSIDTTENLEFLTFKADLWRSLFSWILLVSMMFFLSYGWYHGFITLGDFAFIGAVCFYVRRTVWVASIQLSDFFKEIGTAQEALSFLPHPRNPEAETNKNSFPSIVGIKETSLEFKNVNFSYDSQQPLFKSLNLYIPPGQKLGIMGPSGAGKTSFVHLLLGLYKPTQGSIQINNWDIKAIPLEQRRELFSYAPQTPSLLHCSIYDNIAFGKPQASSEEVYEAAEICLCEDFVSSLKDGYQTIIGEGGYKLSGGQRQRIALARAYLKKAPIFILDEATSGLELTLEESLLERLSSNLKDHTLLVISHRISTLKKLDRILSFENGYIVFDNSVSEAYYKVN